MGPVGRQLHAALSIIHSKGATLCDFPWAAKRHGSLWSPWQEGQWSMRWWLGVFLLCLGLAWGNMACAPQLLGPTAAGYYFTVQRFPASIFPGQVAEVLATSRMRTGARPMAFL
jgi:hypothetical protein